MAFTHLIPWRASSPTRSSAAPVLSLQREINRMFDELWGQEEGEAQGLSTQSFFPEVDVDESDEHIDVTIDVPGIAEDELSLSLTDEGETLIVEGEKKSERESTSEGVHRTERRYGRFRRAIGLPASVDTGDVDATCKDGVLKVHMKKRPQTEESTKKIPINAG